MMSYEIGYARTGSRLHRGVTGGAAACKSLRFNTQLARVVVTYTATSIDEIVGEAYAASVNPEMLCEVCCGGIRQRLAKLVEMAG